MEHPKRKKKRSFRNFIIDVGLWDEISPICNSEYPVAHNKWDIYMASAIKETNASYGQIINTLSAILAYCKYFGKSEFLRKNITKILMKSIATLLPGISLKNSWVAIVRIADKIADSCDWERKS